MKHSLTLGAFLALSTLLASSAQAQFNGSLANHLLSVAGSEDRGKLNATFVNPFFTYNWKSGAGITLNVEYTHDWENDVDVLVLNFPNYGVRAAVVLVFPK